MRDATACIYENRLFGERILSQARTNERELRVSKKNVALNVVADAVSVGVDPSQRCLPRISRIRWNADIQRDRQRLRDSRGAGTKVEGPLDGAKGGTQYWREGQREGLLRAPTHHRKARGCD